MIDDDDLIILYLLAISYGKKSKNYKEFRECLKITYATGIKYNRKIRLKKCRSILKCVNRQ